MSTKKISLVRNDTRPQVVANLRDESTGVVVDLTGASAMLYFRAVGSTTLQASVSGVLLTGYEEDDGCINVSAPYNVPGAGGRVGFQWGAGDLDCPAGEYEGEIEVTFSDGARQTVFEPLKFKLREEFA
jgi:hypothetical protein